jgi:hypothetical protein
MRLEARLAAIERRAGFGVPLSWVAVVVDLTSDDTREAAIARHFGAGGVPRHVELVVVEMAAAPDGAPAERTTRSKGG